MQKLIAVVQATNQANSFANSLYDTLKVIFTPLVGQKIIKSDLKLIAKYKGLLPTFPNTPQLQVFRVLSEYDLAWSVKACVNYENSWEYSEVTVYLGDIQKQVLTEIKPKHIFKTDYTVEYVREKQRRLEFSRRQLNEAQNALYPFSLDMY